MSWKLLGCVDVICFRVQERFRFFLFPPFFTEILFALSLKAVTLQGQGMGEGTLLGLAIGNISKAFDTLSELMGLGYRQGLGYSGR
jgi:hypothetical protein